MTLALLRAVDPAAAVARRRANYERLRAAVADLRSVRPLFDELPDGVCPLELPILVADRDGWVAALAARGVDAYPWWAGYHPAIPWDRFEDACALKDHVVALPVHHDLDDASLDRVASAARGVARAA